MKEFNVNSGFLYAVTAVVIAFVLAQSVFFLVKAARRARQLGIARGDRPQNDCLQRAVYRRAGGGDSPGRVTLSKFLGRRCPGCG